MKVLFATFELAPFTKVGGLADVMGSLPKYLQSDDMEMAIFTPLIGSINQEKYNIQEILLIQYKYIINPNLASQLHFLLLKEYTYIVNIWQQ